MAPPVMEDNYTVINAIKQYPILYDMGHPAYNDKLRKNAAWDVAAQQVNMTGENLKKKWKNLRDCYFKYLKNFTGTTGSRLKTYERYKKWQWADEMEFLKEHMGISSEIERESENIAEKEINQNSVVTRVNSRSVELLNTRRVMLRPRRKIYKSNRIVEPAQELSSLQHLMLSYAKTIDTFSDRRKSITKMKLAQLIMEAELEEYEEKKTRNSMNELYYSSSHMHDVSDDDENAPQDIVIKEETILI